MRNPARSSQGAPRTLSWVDPVRIEPLEIQVMGSWAFARNHVTGTVTVNPSGEVIAVDSKQIVIYRRGSSGDWRIARLISNSNS